MADTSLIIGNGNWAVKETSLLGYNIIQSKYVPIEMTVSRATTATRVNSAGLIEISPKNLLTYSEQFDNASWNKYDATISANATISPNGTLTADKLIEGTLLDIHYTNKNITNSNSLFSFSVFAKKSERNFLFLQAFATLGNNFAYIPSAYFNLDNGTLGTVSSATATIQDYGNGWYRCTLNCTSIFPQGSLGVGMYIMPATSNENSNYLGNGTSGIFIWGAQAEVGPTATEYFPTTDRFNIPRVDYLNSTTGSLLVEPTRTNVVSYSEQFDNASWNGVNRIITANVTTAPDNTMTADKFIPDNTNGAHNIHRTGLASDAYTFSVFAKAGEETTFSMWLRTASFGAVFDLSTGTITSNSASIIPKIEPYPNGWYRCSVYDATPGTTAHIYGRSGGGFIGNNVNGFFIWGAQAEAGTTVTSYIPTTTIGVTRVADVISKTGISSLIGQTEGTLFVDFNFTQNVNTGRLIAIGDGTLTNRATIFLNANTIQVFIRNVSGTQYSVSSSTILTGRYKVAVRYKQNDFGFYINGVPINTQNSGNLPINLNNFYLATSEFGATAAEIQSINSAQLYKTALDNDQCIDLTN